MGRRRPPRAPDATVLPPMFLVLDNVSESLGCLERKYYKCEVVSPK